MSSPGCHTALGKSGTIYRANTKFQYLLLRKRGFGGQVSTLSAFLPISSSLRLGEGDCVLLGTPGISAPHSPPLIAAVLTFHSLCTPSVSSLKGLVCDTFLASELQRR